MRGSMATTNGAPVDMKLEVVVLGVSDVDRAKAFYEKLGWRLDADFATGAGAAPPLERQCGTGVTAGTRMEWVELAPQSLPLSPRRSGPGRDKRRYRCLPTRRRLPSWEGLAHPAMSHTGRSPRPMLPHFM